MAGAEKLIEKILCDAQTDAEKYWSDAEQTKRKMHEELTYDIEKQKTLIEKEAAQSVEENKRRIAAVYDLEYRKQLLAAKQDMMGRAKALAMKQLLSLSDDKYLALMKEELLSCATSGQGGIAVSKDEKRLGEAFLKDVNAELKKTAGKGDIKLLSERRDIAGGFIYSEGGMEINMSLEALLDQAWQESETDVAGVLFGENE